VTFFTISGHYLLLNAQFLAIVNIIVYAGAIMVLFLFVIMLMNLSKDTEPQKNKWLKLAGAVAGGCLLLVLVAALRNTETRMTEMGTGNIGLIQNLGNVLFSILFLSAMIGAVVIGKREKKPVEDEVVDADVVKTEIHQNEPAAFLNR
jgi:NADH-quinone oxidoreductase subunit J